jgi:transcriptional regulator
MYLPRHFSETDIDILHELIDEVGTATVTTAVDGNITANQVPLLLDRGENCLLGHLARPNAQLQDLAVESEVLVNFVGPEAYISPSWYGDVGMVPTWNFISVQVRGQAEVLDQPDAVLDIVQRLTQRAEVTFDEPWTIDKVPEGKLAKILTSIVGFRIDIHDIQGKFKLSQNRKPGDIAGAIKGLRSRPAERGMAEFMEAHLKTCISR